MSKTALQLDEKTLMYYFDLCDTEEFSSLSNKAQRAEKLYFEYHFKRWQLLLLGECTKKSFECMGHAHEAKVTPGIRGRRSLLNPEDEKKVIENINFKLQSSGIGMTRYEIRLLVCVYFLLLSLFFYRQNPTFELRIQILTYLIYPLRVIHFRWLNLTG